MVDSFHSNSLTGVGDQLWILSQWDRIGKPNFHEIVKHRGTPSKLLNLEVESSDIWRKLEWDKFLLWPLGVGQRLTRWEKVSKMTWKFLSWATVLDDSKRWNWKRGEQEDEQVWREMMRSVLYTMLHLPSVFYKYKSLQIDWEKKRNSFWKLQLRTPVLIHQCPC